ncbi:MAG TPA: hypothetical protein VF432_05065 [Thermoanaerobaculia bacterium]
MVVAKRSPFRPTVPWNRLRDAQPVIFFTAVEPIAALPEVWIAPSGQFPARFALIFA